jgi:hypothetical protein
MKPVEIVPGRLRGMMENDGGDEYNYNELYYICKCHNETFCKINICK